MTGRYSGRCAAREALERIANVGDHGLRIGAERDALRYAEKEARAVLASPCCVTGDQRLLSREDTDKLREEVELDAARRAYAAGFGATEWEAFLTPFHRKILALLDGRKEEH